MKQSLRDFLLTLLISIVVFAVVAFFLIQAAEGLMGDVVGNVRSSRDKGKDLPAMNETAENPTATGEGTQARHTASMLFMVLDDQKKTADAIFFIGINSEKKSATVALIPANTGVTQVGIKYGLGELYSSRSVNAMQNFLKDEIGMEPQYYLAITRDGLSNWVDFIGGIPFNVPQDMEAFDSASNRKISLHAGSQTLSGDQVAQLFSFKNYTGGVTARDDVLLSFARAFCGQFLSSANLSTARNIFYNVSYHMNTNFEEQDLTHGGALFFTLNECSPNYIRIPGATDADGYYSISTTRAQPMFELYR